jgi:hypothetical protein
MQKFCPASAMICDQTVVECATVIEDRKVILETPIAAALDVSEPQIVLNSDGSADFRSGETAGVSPRDLHTAVSLRDRSGPETFAPVRDDDSTEDAPILVPLEMTPALDSSDPADDASDASFKITGSLATRDENLAAPWNPSESYVKRANFWRQRQRKKMLSAIRRHIEWTIKTEGSKCVDRALSLDRVTELTERQEDVMEAVRASKKIRLAEMETVIELVTEDSL